MPYRFDRSLAVLRRRTCVDPDLVSASPNVLLVPAAMHRRLVDAHDLIVALYHAVAEVAALFGHRLEPSEARWTLRALRARR